MAASPPNTNPAPIAPVTEVIGGVDTHTDTHTAAALDQLGRLLGTAVFPATPTGYAELTGWLAGHGPTGRVGVEGTGSYGAGLSRHLQAAGITVVEVTRPRRPRGRGKSDPIDAENAARAVHAGTATATPKTRDGAVEAIRMLHTARATAVKARTAAYNTLVGLLTTAPEPFRALLAGTAKQRVAACAALRPAPAAHSTEQAAASALSTLAQRIGHLNAEVQTLTAQLKTLTTAVGPGLLAEVGIGPESAAQLLVTAGDNPDRLRSEASFAALCGVNPIPASSGKTSRHRLNRGGDRQANRALHTIALTRMRCHEPTRHYVARARAQGKTNRDITRCVKRYLARRVYRLITARPNPKSLCATV